MCFLILFNPTLIAKQSIKCQLSIYLADNLHFIGRAFIRNSPMRVTAQKRKNLREKKKFLIAVLRRISIVICVIRIQILRR